MGLPRRSFGHFDGVRGEATTSLAVLITVLLCEAEPRCLDDCFSVLGST